jgi:uncharacterized spore protein YtfJ
MGGEGTGGGTGGAGSIKPVAVIIINQEGVRVESIKGGFSSALQGLASPISKAVEKCADRFAGGSGKGGE